MCLFEKLSWTFYTHIMTTAWTPITQASDVGTETAALFDRLRHRQYCRHIFVLHENPIVLVQGHFTVSFFSFISKRDKSSHCLSKAFRNKYKCCEIITFRGTISSVDFFERVYS